MLLLASSINKGRREFEPLPNERVGCGRYMKLRHAAFVPQQTNLLEVMKLNRKASFFGWGRYDRTHQ